MTMVKNTAKYTRARGRSEGEENEDVQLLLQQFSGSSVERDSQEVNSVKNMSSIGSRKSMDSGFVGQ